MQCKLKPWIKEEYPTYHTLLFPSHEGYYDLHSHKCPLRQQCAEGAAFDDVYGECVPVHCSANPCTLPRCDPTASLGPSRDPQSPQAPTQQTVTTTRWTSWCWNDGGKADSWLLRCVDGGIEVVDFDRHRPMQTVGIRGGFAATTTPAGNLCFVLGAIPRCSQRSRGPGCPRSHPYETCHPRCFRNPAARAPRSATAAAVPTRSWAARRREKVEEYVPYNWRFVR